MSMRIKPKTLLISLTAAVALYALLGFLLLPAVALHLVNKQFEQRATVPARLDSIKFNPFTLELTLNDLHIGEPERPQVAFSRLYANLQVDSLWTSAVHLRDVELEQASTQVRFAEDGTLNLTELFLLPEPEEPAVEPSDSGPFPVRIDRLALIGNSLQFQDLRTAQPVEFGYDAVDIELTQLSTLPHDNPLMQVSASGPYGARIDWEGQLSISPLTSSGTLEINEAQLSTFWPYVHEQLPVQLNSGALNLSSRYQLSLVEGTELSLSDVRLQLSNLDLASNNNPLLRLNNLEISDTSMDLVQREVRLGAVHSEGLEAWAARQKDGQLDWLAVLPPPAPATEPTSDEQGLTEPDAADIATATETADSSEPEQPWRILLSQAQLRDYHLHLTDQQPSKPVALNIGPLNLDLSDFDSQSESAFQLGLDTQLNESGKLTINGDVRINPISAALQVETQNIDLTLAQSYIEPLVKLELRSGLLSSTVQIQLQQLEPLQLEVQGQAGVQQLHIVDSLAQRDLLKWQRLQLEDIHYQGNNLSISQVNLQQPYVRFSINQDMSTNFSDLVVPQPANSAPATDNSDPFGIRIGGININNGSANFADFSLTPNFATGIEQLNGKIGTLDNQSTRTAAVALNGKVDKYAPVTIKGSLTPFEPLSSLDIATSFKNMELTTLTPYSGKFAGYQIRKGRLNLDLHYQINQG